MGFDELWTGVCVGGVSGVGCDEGGASIVKVGSVLPSLVTVAVAVVVAVAVDLSPTDRLASVRVANGNSSEGSESVST